MNIKVEKLLVIGVNVILWQIAQKMIYQYQSLFIKVASGIVEIGLVVEVLLTQLNQLSLVH